MSIVLTSSAIYNKVNLYDKDCSYFCFDCIHNICSVIKGRDNINTKPPGSGGVRQEIKKTKLKELEYKDNRIEIKEKREIKDDDTKQREEAKKNLKYGRKNLKLKWPKSRSKKKEVVERVDNRLSGVNKNPTAAALTKHLENMSAILIRIQDQGQEKIDGVDIGC